MRISSFFFLLTLAVPVSAFCQNIRPDRGAMEYSRFQHRACNLFSALKTDIRGMAHPGSFTDSDLLKHVRKLAPLPLKRLAAQSGVLHKPEF